MQKLRLLGQTPEVRHVANSTEKPGAVMGSCTQEHSAPESGWTHLLGEVGESCQGSPILLGSVHPRITAAHSQVLTTVVKGDSLQAPYAKFDNEPGRPALVRCTISFGAGTCT